MSNKIAYLGLRLQGPMQSWGFDSQYNYRKTALMPSKSALVGLCCASMGIDRGSERESIALTKFRETKLLVVTLPLFNRRKKTVPVRRIQDYHTVQNTMKANGGLKDTHLTHRQYLCDANFIAVISGDREFLAEVARGLQNPVWGVWLGRKSCVPTAPILAVSNLEDKLFETEELALDILLGSSPLVTFTHQRDVIEFEQGIDSLPDVPLSFDSIKRSFSLRRVRLIEGKAEVAE